MRLSTWSESLHKKWSFPLRASSVTKSAGCIYWRNPWWKSSFFFAVSCISVKTLISLVVNFLSEPKSISYLLKHYIARRVTSRSFEQCLKLTLFFSLHSIRILLYSSKSCGFTLIAFTLNESTMCKPIMQHTSGHN